MYTSHTNGYFTYPPPRDEARDAEAKCKEQLENLKKNLDVPIAHKIEAMTGGNSQTPLPYKTYYRVACKCRVPYIVGIFGPKISVLYDAFVKRPPYSLMGRTFTRHSVLSQLTKPLIFQNFTVILICFLFSDYVFSVFVFFNLAEDELVAHILYVFKQNVVWDKLGPELVRGRGVGVAEGATSEQVDE